jgi:hypothetical protein
MYEAYPDAIIVNVWPFALTSVSPQGAVQIYLVQIETILQYITIALTQHHHRRLQLAHLQTIYSHQLTVIHHQRITINQFFSTIQISLYKPRSCQGIQYKGEADNGLCE